MTIDSIFSGINLLRVSRGADGKTKQDGSPHDRKKKSPQSIPPSPYPVLNEQGQTMGWLIDIKV